MCSTRLALVPHIAAILSFVAHAGTPVVPVAIDLATQREGTTAVHTLDIHGPTVIAVSLIHCSPSTAYDVAMQVDNLELPTITLGSAPATGASGGLAALRLDGTSADTPRAGSIFGARGGTTTSTSTTAMPLRSEMTPSTIDLGVANAPILRPGQRLTVVVRSVVGGTEHTWTANFTTPARGAWRMSFGLAFPVMLMQDEEYTARRDTGRSYVIRRGNARTPLRLIPTLLFHWLPRDDELEVWSFGVVGGLGLDLKSPAALLGGSITFNQNITVAIGAVVHTIARLDGRYAEGDRVFEDLNAAQLRREVYGANPFFALSFRFAENPFGK